MISKKAQIASGGIGLLVLAGMLSIVAIFWLSSSSSTPCSQPLSAAELETPQHYVGSFQWNGDTVVQRVALDVKSVRTVSMNSDWTQVLEGRGTYVTDRRADFDFRIVIDDENRFEMTESNPNVRHFVTEGRHLGTVSSNGIIRATWVGEGGSGTLELEPAQRSKRAELSSIVTF